jgi:hypothetical protein
MAKAKSDMVLSETVAALVKKLGKEKGPKDTMEAFKKAHPDSGFTDGSIKQAINKARNLAGFTRKVRKVRPLKVGRYAQPSANGDVMTAVNAAKQLIALCGGKDDARQLIDALE